MASVKGNDSVERANNGGSTGQQKNRGPTIDRTVFGVSLALVVVFCIVGALWPASLGNYGNAALMWLVADAGWLFVLAATGFVAFALTLAFSRYGRIPLSRSGEPPEFSTISWVAMMFSAGMGIGLIFFGVQEPVSHTANPAPWLDVQGGTADAARLGLGYTFFHWGFQPWAIYAVVALALAYSTFRMGRGNLLSSPFQALTRKNVEETKWGKGINIWAIVATKFGGATSLGLGALQIAGGIWLFTGIGDGFGQQSGGSTLVPTVVIVILVALAVLSAVSGVSRGIKWLSNTNMVIAALLVVFVLVAGPTAYLLNLIPESWGAYLANLVPWSFRAPTSQAGVDWMADWTIFYWAWWISWTPFVSTFIARISRGRTIREFVLGVLLVPTVVSSLWFVVFGGAGISAQLTGAANIAGAANEAVAFFNLLQTYPAYTVTGIVVMFLVAIFWVSGADASALVLATLSSHGATEPNRWLTALWAVLSAAVAVVLLYVGGLQALQTFTIIVAAPFVFVMIGLCWSVLVDLRRDPLRQRRPGPVRGHAPSPTAAAPFEVPVSAQTGDGRQVLAPEPAEPGDAEQQAAPAGESQEQGTAAHRAVTPGYRDRYPNS